MINYKGLGFPDKLENQNLDFKFVNKGLWMSAFMLI